jgi:hypothetical protein
MLIVDQADFNEISRRSASSASMLGRNGAGWSEKT